MSTAGLQKVSMREDGLVFPWTPKLERRGLRTLYRNPTTGALKTMDGETVNPPERKAPSQAGAQAAQPETGAAAARFLKVSVRPDGLVFPWTPRLDAKGFRTAMQDCLTGKLVDVTTPAETAAVIASAVDEATPDELPPLVEPDPESAEYLAPPPSESAEQTGSPDIDMTPPAAEPAAAEPAAAEPTSLPPEVKAALAKLVTKDELREYAVATFEWETPGRMSAKDIRAGLEARHREQAK